jgi:hyperosmotically inducible protein
MKRLAICLSIAFATMITACAPTENSRGTGQFIDDASVTTRVKTQLAQTAGLGEALAINVDTYRGVVSLAGFVNNAEQIQMAVQAAQRVPGVVSVRNNLQIKPRPQ